MLTYKYWQSTADKQTFMTTPEACEFKHLEAGRKPPLHCSVTVINKKSSMFYRQFAVTFNTSFEYSLSAVNESDHVIYLFSLRHPRNTKQYIQFILRRLTL